MATGTLFLPLLTTPATDADNEPVSGAKAYFYLAGTVTPVSVYTNVLLTVAHAVPVEADGNGRFAEIFLTPGVSYKLKLTTSAGVELPGSPWDYVSAMPISSSNQNVLGTAGENITSGQVVYLSDGSGSKTAGQWYRADSANGYSSVIPEIGIAPNAITSATTGTITLAGQMTGLSGLSVGSTYYVSTTGTMTSTAPTNRRFLGVADTTTSLILTTDPPVPLLDVGIVEGRLSLTTAVPVTIADVTAATTIYFTPYRGNRIALFDGTNWTIRSFSELSIAVPATTVQMYDVFVYDNAGVSTLELLAWTNDTTRATALVAQDGVLSKTGVLTRRYVGSVRTAGVSGQTEDSFAKRYVWNYYNRVPRLLKAALETANSWGYTTATWRQANANTANQLECVVGVAEVVVEVRVLAVGNNSTGDGTVDFYAGIGEDSTSALAALVINDNGPKITGGNTQAVMKQAWLTKYPAVGRHFYAWLEYSEASGTTTWYGDDGGALAQTGISGRIDG